MLEHILYDLRYILDDPFSFATGLPVLIPPAAFLLGLILDLTVRKSRRRAPTGKWFRRYTDRAHTPMGWHWFMLLGVLPLPAFRAGYMIYDCLTYPDSPFLAMPLDWVLILAANLAWMCVSYAAFRRRSMAGAYFLAARYLAGFLHGLGMYLDAYARLHSLLSFYEVIMFYNLEWLAVTLLYYHRRAPLFSPDVESPVRMEGPCPEQ